MSARRLLIDAGNTRLKWAVVEGDLWRAQGSAYYTDLSELARLLEKGDDCYIASVARAQHEEQIKLVMASLAIEPQWLKAESRFLDIQNTYVKPQQLGVDRWMAMIGARQRTRAATLVVSAGTAMTVDALSADGVFLGGLIVPGLAMMQQSLQEGAARVAKVEGSWQAFPRNTGDAVQSGILAALCGAIQQQYSRLSEAVGGMPHCILSGGNAEQLLLHLALSADHAPALVLEGIDRVAKEDKTG
jgi:type III pantothenate kinase